MSCGLWAVGCGRPKYNCDITKLGGENERERQTREEKRKRLDGEVLVWQQYLNTTVLQKTRSKEGGKGVRASEQESTVSMQPCFQLSFRLSALQRARDIDGRLLQQTTVERRQGHRRGQEASKRHSLVLLLVDEVQQAFGGLD